MSWLRKIYQRSSDVDEWQKNYTRTGKGLEEMEEGIYEIKMESEQPVH